MGDKQNLATELPINYFTYTDDLPVSAQDIRAETLKDPVLSKVLNHIMNGWPKHTTGKFRSKVSVNNRKVVAVIFVFDGKSSNLMPASTSRALQLLQIQDVGNKVTENNFVEVEVKSNFSECLKGWVDLRIVKFICMLTLTVNQSLNL